MIKRIIFLLFFITLLTHNSIAGLSVGQWQVFPSFSTPSQIIEQQNNVLFTADGYLFRYEKGSGKVEYMTKNEGLSDSRIRIIVQDPNDELLFIGYENANIDLLSSNNRVVNIPDLKNKTLALSKNINSVFFTPENIYIGCDFGIVVLNRSKNEIKESYILKQPIYGIAIQGEAIYASTEQGIIKGKLNDNLLENSQWKKISNTLSKEIAVIDGKLLVRANDNSLFTIDKTDQETPFMQGSYFNKISTLNDGIVCYSEYAIKILDLSGEERNSATLNKNITQADGSDEELWTLSKEGVSKISLSDNSFVELIPAIRPNAPLVNRPYNTNYNNGRLIVTDNGAYLRPQFTPSPISILEKGEWTHLTEKDFPPLQHGLVDLYTIVTSPVDPSVFSIGSWFYGLLKFKDNKFVQAFDSKNSPIERMSDWCERAKGLTYDKYNNLWITNFAYNKAIHVLKSDSTWASLSYNSLKNKEDIDQILVHSRSNTKWTISTRRFPGPSFVFAFDEQGTFDYSADDKTKHLQQFVDQDGVTTDYNQYICMAEDMNGYIWIGTNKGILTITNPSSVFSNNFQATRIKIPRNDGTPYADYLLVSEYIKTIAVDGANRKWIGTKNSGVYLISANGLETIHHFTTENSPLQSNEIVSLSIDPQTGVVYIGTYEGLCAYRGTATKGENTLDHVYPYPNPVRPEYSGPITIAGLKTGSLVKITDSAGNLLKQGLSNGGQFIWDGLNLSGQRVKTGVYLVFASDDTGSEGMVTKILVVN